MEGRRDEQREANESDEESERRKAPRPSSVKFRILYIKKASPKPPKEKHSPIAQSLSLAGGAKERTIERTWRRAVAHLDRLIAADRHTVRRRNDHRRRHHSRRPTAE